MCWGKCLSIVLILGEHISMSATPVASSCSWTTGRRAEACLPVTVSQCVCCQHTHVWVVCGHMFRKPLSWVPSPFFSAAQETLLTGPLSSVALDCAYLPSARGPTSLPVAVLLPLALCPRCSIQCLSTQRTEVGSSHSRMAPTSSLSNTHLHYSQDALRLPHSFTSSADMCVVPEASYCAKSITLTYIRKWQPFPTWKIP